MARATSSSPPDGPRGRDEVVAALVDAAGRELAAKGAAGVSVRAVAAAAGVNHGLVHRHFGSKDALVAAVLDDLAGRMATRAEADPAWPFGASGGGLAGDDELLDRFWRILARTILDGGDPAALQRHHPYVEAFVARLCERGLPEGRARLVAAQSVALALGWLLYEPFLEVAAGLDPADRPARRRALSAVASDMIRRGSGSGSGSGSEPPGPPI
jgi:AcrR family transcriptional regulator